MNRFKHKETGVIYTINRILDHKEGRRLDSFVGIQIVPESKEFEDIIIENKSLRECADYVERTFDIV